jgi:choline dehydrogenase-like flavoprotein
MSNGTYDIIIIGSGAGGGTLVRHLAPSGKSILLLERGDWMKYAREPGAEAEVVRKAEVDAQFPGYARSFDPAQSLHEK